MCRNNRHYRLALEMPGASFRMGSMFRVFVRLAVCLALAFSLPPLPEAALAASSGKDSSALERQIAREQEKAKSRRESLSRLTRQERELDRELAGIEDRIVSLEEGVAKEQTGLAELASSDAELREKGEALLAEQTETEAAMAEVLRVLWELHAKRLGVGGRDLPDWHVTDREHAWSVELLASLDAYRKEVAERREALRAVADRRASLQAEAERRIRKLNTEKEAILRNRVAYSQRLAALRKEKSDTEKDLASLLALVRDLNLRREAAEEEGDISKARGKLPWPVIGPVRTKFVPGASPPLCGLTFGLEGDTPVRAVHWGKVVHNDVLRGLGRVVILLHGEDYYSLYAFLSESSLRIGQEVARGDIVGISGYVTTIEDSGLYFELRQHQKAINPEPWLRKL